MRRATKEDFKTGTTLICDQEGYEFTLTGQAYADDSNIWNARSVSGEKIIFVCEAEHYFVKGTETIEYTYSSIHKKHVIRTTGIQLSGRGIKEVNLQGDTAYNGNKCLYNGYLVTKKAFENICNEYPQISMY